MLGHCLKGSLVWVKECFLRGELESMLLRNAFAAHTDVCLVSAQGDCPTHKDVSSPAYLLVSYNLLFSPTECLCCDRNNHPTAEYKFRNAWGQQKCISCWGDVLEEH